MNISKLVEIPIGEAKASETSLPVVLVNDHRTHIGVIVKTLVDQLMDGFDVPADADFLKARISLNYTRIAE